MPLGVLRDICVFDDHFEGWEQQIGRPTLNYARFKNFISGMPKSLKPVRALTADGLGSEWENAVNLNEVDGTDTPVRSLKTKSLVMKAVENNGAALQHAGEDFQKDVEVVQAAYNDRKWSIRYAKKSAIAKLSL